MQRIIKKVAPATLQQAPKEKRVAAYARVSSGREGPLHSLSAQISYYNSSIQKTPGWQYAGVYADEALTGTKENRVEFQKLLKACHAGEIDMVITKSVSRFARNTVTTLKTIRELRLIGVDVYFEEQNIHTLTLQHIQLLQSKKSFSPTVLLLLNAGTQQKAKLKIQQNPSQFQLQ